MSKYIAIPGMCATHKRPVGFQFMQDGDIFIAVGSFSATGSATAGSDAAKVSGKFVNSAQFAQRGCKLCGNNAIYQCGRCKTFYCLQEGTPQVTCPSCGAVTSLRWVDNIDEIDESSADVSGQ